MLVYNKFCRHDRDPTTTFPGPTVVPEASFFHQLLVVDSRGYSRKMMFPGPPGASENFVGQRTGAINGNRMWIIEINGPSGNILAVCPAC